MELVEVNSRRDKIPQDVNLIFGGGGQDKQQEYVSEELQFFKKEVHELIFDKKIPALTVCGTYQLFGHYFKTEEGREIPGISIFDMTTVSSHVRKTGNVVIKLNELSCYHDLDHDSSEYDNLLVGFENHWGNTFLKSKISTKILNTIPLGIVIKGYGNNGSDGTEGAIMANCLGTYLHGPLLPKNPQLADWLIMRAIKINNLEPIDDSLEFQTREGIIRIFI